MNDSSRRSWLLALLLGLAIPVGAATPTVDIQDVFPFERHVISSGPIRFRTVARGTDADPVTSLSVMVTSLTDNSLVLSNSSPVSSAPIVALDQAFTPSRIGQYQITATANTLSMTVGSGMVTVIVTNVARGERPYTQGIYLSSHNSYWREEAIDNQIDEHNVWQIEFDVAWDSGGLVVDHDCADLPLARPLSAELDELNNSTEFSKRFTVVYLELKDPHADFQQCRDEWPALDTYRTAILNTFSNYFDMTRFYTPDEFGGFDRRYWPSIQELMRRGKNGAIIVNEIVTSGYQQPHPVLFSETIRDDGDYATNQVQVSLAGASDPYPGVSTVPPIYLWRVYPASNLKDDGDDDDWDKYVARGFNFIAMNTLTSRHIITDFNSQAPEPTYVDASASGDNWGTLSQPFNSFEIAYFRASPMTTVRLKPTTYTLVFTNVFSKSVVLKKDGTDAGNPIIRKP